MILQNIPINLGLLRKLLSVIKRGTVGGDYYRPDPRGDCWGWAIASFHLAKKGGTVMLNA